MKVITLTQPWATLVAIGAKRIETRSWATTYRGPLLIHAAAGYGNGGKRRHKELCGTEPFCSVLSAACEAYYAVLNKSHGVLRAMAESPFMPMGAIVARCDLVEVYEILVGCTGFYAEDSSIHFPLTAQERAFGDYTPGRFAWLLSDVQPLATPIPAKGKLGLWEFDLPNHRTNHATPLPNAVG